eukprot:SAG11_NODE_1239_length_5424_cov_8.855399_1_plen_135_part_00
MPLPTAWSASYHAPFVSQVVAPVQRWAIAYAGSTRLSRSTQLPAQHNRDRPQRRLRSLSRRAGHAASARACLARLLMARALVPLCVISSDCNSDCHLTFASFEPLQMILARLWLCSERRVCLVRPHWRPPHGVP